MEAVLLLVRKGRVARVRDIAKHLNVGMPSVTAALKSLSKRKLVNYDPYQVVTLTDAGLAVAGDIARRHDFLRRFLIDVLGLDEDSAEANACRMEHAVDNAVLQRLQNFAEFIHYCPRAGRKWIEQFIGFCRHGPDRSRCHTCLEKVAEKIRSTEPAKNGKTNNPNIEQGD